MTNLIQDINILTNIPEKALNKVVNLSINSIATTVWEDKQENKDTSEIDLGIGILHIKYIGTDIKYHFEPSDNLRKELKGALQSDTAPVTPKLLSSLKTKFIDIYKEIIG